MSLADTGFDKFEGIRGGESGKFKLGMADSPFKHTTPASYALAAISAVANDPNQMRSLVSGSLISVTHFPHARMRTPLNSVGFAGEDIELRRLEEAFFAKLFLTGSRRKSLPRLATKEDSDFAFSTISTHNNPRLFLKIQTPKPLFFSSMLTHPHTAKRRLCKKPRVLSSSSSSPPFVSVRCES